MKYRTACAIAPARLITQPLRSWAAASAAAPADVHPECHCILYDGIVSAQPAEYGDQYDLIHLGGETAVVVPLDEYQRLRALERRASAEWVAADRPGARSHEEVMAELLGGA
jgi:hypothetical protein